MRHSLTWGAFPQLHAVGRVYSSRVVCTELMQVRRVTTLARSSEGNTGRNELPYCTSSRYCSQHPPTLSSHRSMRPAALVAMSWASQLCEHHNQRPPGSRVPRVASLGPLASLTVYPGQELEGGVSCYTRMLQLTLMWRSDCIELIHVCAPQVTVPVPTC